MVTMLVNDSNTIHVIGPGINTYVVSPERGAPVTSFTWCRRMPSLQPDRG